MPIKGQSSSDWIPKQDPTKCCLQDTHFKYKCRQFENTRVRKMYNIFYININHKKVLITMVESGRVNFKMKGNTKDKERHGQEDTTIICTYEAT